MRGMEIPLSKENREYLKRAHRKNTGDSYKIKDRIKAILMLDSGYGASEIAEILLLDRSTIWKWRDKFKTSKTVEEYLSKDAYIYTGKLSEKQKEEVAQYVDSSMIRNSLEVSLYIRKKFGIEYSRSGVIELLHTLGFSYKETTCTPSKASKKVQERFKASYEEFETLLNEDQTVVFADAMHISHNNQASRAWIKVGQKKYIPTNSGRDNLNLHGVYNPHEQDTLVYAYDTINQDAVIDFFRKLEAYYFDRHDIFVVLDNARYYKGKKVKEYLKNSRIKLISLPTSSPNLNLIERFWKVVIESCVRHSYYEKFEVFKRSVLDFCNQKSQGFKDVLSRSVGKKLNILDDLAYSV